MRLWPLGTVRWDRHDGHASEACLAGLVLGGREAAEPAWLAHLSACPRCRARLEALEGHLEEDRQLAMAAADRLFTATRLERQHEAVLARIGGTRPAGRVLRFPGSEGASVTPRRQIVRRSVAAAAVMGLLIGALAGRLFPHTSFLFSAARRPAAVLPAAPLQASVTADEAFLREFEDAVAAAPVEPLRTLDALTPQLSDDRAPR